ncbi:hypothetical protein C6P42_003634, partial [Pichia californica]
LPSSYKRKSPFHISQLRRQKSLPDSVIKAPAKAIAFQEYKDGSVEMEIDKIISHKKVAKGYKMLVQFVDGSQEDIRLSSLKQSAPILVREYLDKHPDIGSKTS